MMAAKARVMGDTKTLAQILACDYNPTAIKQMGRRVTPYSEEKWVAARLECVTPATSSNSARTRSCGRS